MAGETFTNALIVEADGRPLPADIAVRLVAGYVDDSSTVPDMFLLRFRDPDHTVLSSTGISIGSPVKLYAKAGDHPVQELLLAGEVTALEGEMDAGGTFTVVRGLDHSHRLFRGRRVASYKQMTVSDIAVAVANRAGLRIGRVDPTTEVLDQVIQPNITDWEFIRTLAEEVGAEVVVLQEQFQFRMPAQAAHAPGVSTPVEQSPFVLEKGRNLLTCRAAVTSVDQVQQIEVRGWDVKDKRAVVGRAQAQTTEAFSLGMAPGDVVRPFGDSTFVTTDTPYTTQNQVDAAAQALAATVAGSFAELEAVAMGNPQLRAGKPVTLTEVGRPFEGKYTITGSRHVFDPAHGYQTWITVKGAAESSLFGLTSGGGSLTRMPRVPGLVTATVSDTKDPDQQGRVKLCFPWLSPDYVSDWARTAQLGGKNGGGVFGAEVGDEVLVGFEQGCLDRPYVVGGLYNGVDKPSSHETDLVDRTSGAVNRRAFVARSGHAIEMFDCASGPKGVRVMTGDGKLKLDLDQKNTQITVHSDGSVVIEAKQKVTVKADQGVRVDAGSGELELTGQSVSVTGRSGVRVDGGPSCSIQASLVRIN
ncbi:phage protein D [Streptomyces sp. SLBN-118]|uniref:VgrG-related protein n=1 Tax=Streptomyces sp. SLBN-118 TaxID=2768454 RepID=UPI0011543C99|nr:VgrG-related protein [Streptomyces sp. SLBN-118]TQK44159.1 phage protein D [Streptomyces sp. SLBN-118]